jgi:ribitol-5-phosphate 2-dehydrogenase (NADP+) / D-ribitol-5-phosphate cytidylyltransferase
MKKRIALIFGDRGGIGNATRKYFYKHEFRIIPVNRDIIDFNSDTSDQEIQSLLTNSQPDVVVNCAGVFHNGWKHDHVETMNVNFGSNWSIIRHYLNPENQKKISRIILIGSSSYSSGRAKYPLYSASKAALFNLWQGAQDCLENSPITVDLLNPVRTLTKMSSVGKEIDPTLDYLTPEQVAEQIYKLVDENQPGRCIDMTFEETK